MKLAGGFSHFLRALLVAALAIAAAPRHAAATATGPNKFLPTFTVYYGGGPSLVASEIPTPAKFDLIDLDRFRYQDVAPSTWAAIKADNPAAQIYLYEIGPEVQNNQDSLPQVDLNALGRYNVSRGHPMGSLNGNHPELFLLDASGNRIYNKAYSNPTGGTYSYLMDFGSSAYQSYWTIAVQADIASQPWVADGVFADNCLALAAAGGYSATSAKYPTDSAWSAAMTSFAGAITAGVHGYGQKLWCNRGSTGTAAGAAAWRALDASANPPDAVMDEGAFAVSWGGSATQFFPESEWKLQLDTMASIQNSYVTVMSHTALAPGGSGTDNWGDPVTFWQSLWYAMGSFLLGKNDTLNNDFFMFHGSDDNYNAIVRYSEYDNIDLGKSVGPYQMTTVGGVDVYWREFQKGYVYVNPTPNNVPSLALPQPGQQLTHDNLLSTLSSIPVVSSITLNAHNAAIVLKVDPPADTTAPTVSTTSPASGATVSGTITVSADASDNVGVAGVQFQLDGANLGAAQTTAPYSASWDTTSGTNGSHTLTAIAWDAAGNTATSAPVTVTVSNAPPPDTTPPTVSITSPGSGATVSGTVSVTASASDNVGVAGVQFRLDGANLGAEDTTAPYSVSWDTTSATNGSHTLTAIARDAAGNKTTSAAVSVGVANKSAHPAARTDFNGDGRADILWRSTSTGQEAIWLMNGASVAGSGTFATVSGTSWHIVGTGDFNGDGKADILWRNVATGANVIWLMNGAAIASAASITPQTDLGWQVAGVADFNGDGKADILWRNASTGQEAIWLMNGASVAGSGTFATVSDTSWHIVGTGDFNGDGKADILWRNVSTGANVIWLMNGAAIASAASITPQTDLGWQVAGVADFNGDGKPDILWRNASTGVNAIWLMNGSAVASGANFSTVLASTGWAIAEVADFDGDGKADILWRNVSTGANVIWLMNGAAIANAVTTATASLDWSVEPPAQ